MDGLPGISRYTIKIHDKERLVKGWLFTAAIT